MLREMERCAAREDISMQRYLAGIDIGGTFTDVVLIDRDGRVTTAKSPSTPPNFADGVVDALTLGASRLGLSLQQLCARFDMVTHGTTVGTNALIQKRGARVGIITTRGFEDTMHIMRGSRGYSGRDLRKVAHFSEGPKPQPLVPKRQIRGVSERVDSFGQVVAKLNEAELATAIDELLGLGVEAIAVCFLWSFKHPEHERRAVAMVKERAPDLFVTASVDLVPKWGEYERTTAVALNAYIGPLTSRYLRTIDARLKQLGYAAPLQIMQCGGGAISVERAIEAPLLTLDSGPVAGVTGSSFLAELMGDAHVITTDMGGTSFDVGVIHEGRAAASYKSSVNQYEYFLPKVDIQAIGAGGGSLAWIDETTGTLHVGPDSAGSRPGPVCYGRGGTVPTVTDAALVLGYLDPSSFAGGKLALDREAAASAIGALGARIGLTTDQCAAGICRIVEFNMADIIRRTTVEKGHDPRDFVLFAFGGAGPAHAGMFAREVGVKKVIVPQRRTASVWCAFGAASADVLHVYERANLMASPFDLAAINGELAALARQGAAQLQRESAAETRFSFSIDLRHRGQINEVEVPIAGDQIDAAALGDLVALFFDRYEAMYGPGSALRQARLEAVTFRCRASAITAKPVLQPARELAVALPKAARRGVRSVYWTEQAARQDTPVFDGDVLLPGNRIAGPAIVETLDTTVVVHHGQALTVDALGNFELDLNAA
jgi:N-methylhydantoinase A